jgi:hypothetical protein
MRFQTVGAFVSLLCGAVYAQSGKPSDCYIVWVSNNPANPPSATVLWASAPSPDKITTSVFTAGGVTLVNTGPAFRAGGIQFDLAPMPPPPVGVKEATLALTYAAAEGAVSVTTTCRILTPQQFKDEMLKNLADAAKPGKSEEEKNIFAGFNVADPSGQGAQGNAEIHLNGTLPVLGSALSVTTNLRKSSADNADPKQFDVGLAYRWQHLFITQNVRNVLVAASAANDAALNNALQELDRKFWLATSIDGIGKIEGEAMNLSVSNAVADIPLQFVSRTKAIARQGWFFVRVIPAGFEAGKNLHSDDAAHPKYTIARYKAGMDFGLFWKPRDQERTLIKKLMLEAHGVDRYLFQTESAYDKVAKKAISVTDGNKYYAQADLKIYVADTPQGSYAFRVSFVEGSLPPVFSYTHTFLYGFVFESADK